MIAAPSAYFFRVTTVWEHAARIFITDTAIDLSTYQSQPDERSWSARLDELFGGHNKKNLHMALHTLVATVQSRLRNAQSLW